jgi:hypothetical protein
MTQKVIDYGRITQAGVPFMWAVKYIDGMPCGAKQINKDTPPTNADLLTLTYDVGDEYAEFMDQVWPKVREQQ